MKKTILIILGILVLFSVWSCQKQAPCEPGVIVVVTATFTNTPTSTPTPTVTMTPTPRTGQLSANPNPTSDVVTLDYSINGGTTTSLSYPNTSGFLSPEFYFYSGDTIYVTGTADMSSSAGGLFDVDVNETGVGTLTTLNSTGLIILTITDSFTFP